MGSYSVNCNVYNRGADGHRPMSSVRSARKLGVFDWSGAFNYETHERYDFDQRRWRSGFGDELTRRLTALGNTIPITGRDQAKMDRVKAVFRKVHTFRSDVSDPKACSKHTISSKLVRSPGGQKSRGHTAKPATSRESRLTRESIGIGLYQSGD